MRTWHVQLAIFWVATSFLAAGIFLAPMIAGREPRGQHFLAYGLLGALAVVVFGSMIGEWLGIFGFMGGWWAWFGNQGFEYLDLGRFWQVLLSIGLSFWVAVLFRGLRGRLRREHAANMPWLFFFAALAIPAFYAVGLLARPESHFTTADFWRFWVVHLWVEDFLELFTTVMVAYIFVLLGVVREKVALTVIFLDILLYSAGGVIGTMHHLYFSGTPAEHMALGAFFSAAEVIPLTFLTVEAWSFLQLGARQESRSRTPFPHRWAVMFLVAVGFWNFLGAGIFGFLINLPIISYYQIGTALTANHGHAAMMGVYGMLAAGPLLFALPDPRRPLVKEGGEMELLVAEYRACLDVLRHAFPPWHPPALRIRQHRVLRGPQPGVHHQRHQRPPGVDEAAGGRGVYRRRRAAAAVPMLPGRAPHRSARDVGGAGGHPVHRHRRARNGRAAGVEHGHPP
jgi:nitric oxide reductase subunit B